MDIVFTEMFRNENCEMSTTQNIERTVSPSTDEADDYQIVRWKQGLLAEIATPNGLASMPAARRDLPGWFRFPINATTGQVVAPAFLFLARRCLAGGSSDGSANTLKAYAYDLRAWFEFLALENAPWDTVGQATLDTFFLDLASDCADGTALGVARSTIRRYASTIKKMYADARSRSGVDLKLDFETAKTLGRRPEDAIRPVVPEDLKVLLARLGPLPSVRRPSQSSRLILASLISIVSGPRLFEICAMTVDMIRSAEPDGGQSMAERAIKLRLTKGGKPRSIMVANWLLLALLSYIEGERAAIVAEVGFDCGALFLNHPSAGRNAGMALRAATLAHDFRVVVRTLSLHRNTPGYRSGSERSAKTHSFHDLRHTCACLHYAASSAHMHDPWLEVQRRLGHSLSETTRRVYLSHVGEFSGDTDMIVQSSISRMLF